MRVISKRRLREFALIHAEADGPLRSWYQVCKKTQFANFDQLKKAFRSVDKVGKFTVFNIGGNKFRLIAVIHYQYGKIYVRHVLTHDKYDRDYWKRE